MGSDTNRCSEQTSPRRMPKTRTAKTEDLRSLRGNRDRGPLRGDAAIRVSSVNMIEISLNCFPSTAIDAQIFTHSS
jgi:hypothetical protein